MKLEDFLNEVGPAVALPRASGRMVEAAGFPRVSPEVQAQRNAEQTQILRRELQTARSPVEIKRIQAEIAKISRPDPFAAAGGDPLPPASALNEPEMAAAQPATPMKLEDFLNEGETGGGQAAKPAERNLTPGKVIDRAVLGLKRMGGEAAALADLVLSIPGFTLGVGAQLGGTVAAGARGIPFGHRNDPNAGKEMGRYTAYTAGREIGHEVAGRFMNPLQSLMQTLKGEEFYEGALTTQAMGKFGQMMEDAGRWAERVTGGRVSRDAMPMFVETLMASSPGLAGRRYKPWEDPVMKRALQDSQAKLKAEAELEIKQAADPVQIQVREAQMPVQEQINTLLNIRTPAQRAAEQRARRKDAIGAFKNEPAAGPLPVELELQGRRQFTDAAESIFKAEESAGVRAATEAQAALPENRIGGTVYDTATQPKVPERIGQAEILRIFQKPGHLRTAEDLITLRAARQQEGKVSKDALMLMSAAGIGATVGGLLDDEQLRGATLGGLTGGAAALPFMGMSGSVRSRMGQAGAVKEPGGSWSKDASERISQHLERAYMQDITPDMTIKDSVQREIDYQARIKPIVEPIQRMSRNYLNRYAGTARDPLKDLEIPFGEGTEKLGVLFDRALRSTEVEGPRGKELQWDLPSGGRLAGAGDQAAAQAAAARGAIESYLSHAGDYARQNIPRAKLGQYDLPRLLRETNQADIRMAKQMEKAAGESTKQLPVYKEYPDGFRWVELKLPEKLTEEQAKGVVEKTATADRIRAGESPSETPLGEPYYVAVDANGMAIKNTYTKDIAKGVTRERAYLAGSLAEEGNQMGHCVGGYCEGVARGESRIFSLRDPKGKSHVTVEVEPAGNTRGIDGFGEPVADLDPNPVPNIRQIKGKQNRAPNAEYLPYVQDFVRSGKWGDVGDLGNTGLLRAQDLQRNVTGRFRQAQENLAARQEYYTREELAAEMSKLAGVADPAQRGSASPQLLIGLSAAGLGGLLGSIYASDPLDGLLLGALAGGALGMPRTRERLKAGLSKVDEYIGLTSTQILNRSPALHRRMLDYEKDWRIRAHDELTKAVPWMKGVNDLPAAQRDALNLALLNNDPAAIAAATRTSPEIARAFQSVQTMWKQLGVWARDRGRFKELLEDHFPRRVKDLEGLMGELEMPVRSRIEKKLMEAEQSAMRTRGTGLGPAERDVLVNRELRQHFTQQTYQPGYAKSRTIRAVTPEMAKHYYTPQESLVISVGEIAKDMEMVKLFGKDVVESRQGNRGYINVDKSIGNVLGREMTEGKLSPDEVNFLEKRLKERFGPGEIAPDKWIQDMRNLSYGGLLANPLSAITQLGDPIIASAIYGPRATLTAVARVLSGNKKIGMKDFAMADHIAEDLAWGVSEAGSRRAKQAAAGGAAIGATAGAVLQDDVMGALPGALAGAALGYTGVAGTAAGLRKAMQLSAFKAIDQFGGNVSLNAALAKNTRLAETAKGQKELQSKYGEAYGSDMPQLIKDLQGGQITPLVRSLLFAELSRMRPTSMLETPPAYARNPNGRIFYQLKTFMLKQVDLARREVWNEFKKGDPASIARGLRNATALMAVWGLAGVSTDALKDWLLGKPVEIEFADAAENVLKTFGFAKYVREKMEKGDPVMAPLGMFTPAPAEMMDRIIDGDPRAVQYVPVIGRLYFNWELGGKEQAEIRRRSELRKQGVERDLSPAAEAYRERRLERARQIRERQAN